MLDELLAEIPESVLAILRVPGLGPKRAAAALSRAERHHARRAPRGLRVAPGPANSRASARRPRRRSCRARHRRRGRPAHPLGRGRRARRRKSSPTCSSCKAVEQIEAAGSYRRGKETVGDLDFLVVASDADDGDGPPGRLSPAWPSIIARGDTKMSVRLAAGVQVDLRVVPAESFGAALQYFTGSKEHNIVLRGRAKDARAEDQRVRRVPRREADRRPHGGRGLRARWTCPGFRPSCARPGGSSSGPTPASCPSWSSWTTSAATCTCTARGPTAWRRSRRWPRPPSSAG